MNSQLPLGLSQNARPPVGVPVRGFFRQFTALIFTLLALPALAHADFEFESLDEVIPYAKSGSCEAALIQPLSPRDIQTILGFGTDKNRLNNALEYIHQLTQSGSASQTRLIVYFESLALTIMQDSAEGWTCFPFTGPNGEAGYRATVPFAIVITRDAKIHRAWIPDESFLSGNRWLGQEQLNPI